MIQRGFEWLSPTATRHLGLALVQSLWQGMIAAFALDAILNNGLALCVWRDEGVSDAAFARFCDCFRAREYHPAESAKAGEPAADRERIGQVLVRSVYRDEIRENFDLPYELHRIFHEPIMKHYKEAHRAETELTEEEIQAALRYHIRETEAKGGRQAESWQRTIGREREETPVMLAILSVLHVRVSDCRKLCMLSSSSRDIIGASAGLRPEY